MRRCLLIALSLFASLVATSSAQAVVVKDGGTSAGVALAPGARGVPLPSGVSAVTSSGLCTDPALTSDLWLFGQTDRLPDGDLCYHGGSVLRQNETFALTWDAPFPDGSKLHYWSMTKGYVEQFLRDVADGSGTFTSPYALTPQYTDGSGRAMNSSVFGGGCVDYGGLGGSACEFQNNAGPGHDYPASGCTPAGDSFTSPFLVGTNVVCLTDAQLQSELSTMINQTGMIGRTQPGHTPLVTLLLPPGVEVCVDAAGRLCSSNSSFAPPLPTVSTGTTGGHLAPGSYSVEVTYVTGSGESLPSGPQTVTTTGTTSTITIDSPPPAAGVKGWNAYVTQPGGQSFALQGSTNSIGTPLTLSSVSAGSAPPSATTFCSYHSQVSVNGTLVPYVVQPWTVGTTCDEPSAPSIPQDPTAQQLALAAGSRLVSPLSQSQIAAIVNPALNGWFALDGSEIDDNKMSDGQRCVPLAGGFDSVTVGLSAQNPYLLQREFNNAGLIENDPTTYFGCAPDVILSPQFVVPSAVNPGDEVQFDGSSTASTLIVPNGDYRWNFGDGTSAVGPSVVHSYASGGTYTVVLTVTDRGGNTTTLSQKITVLGGIGAPGGAPSGAWRAHILLMPQSLDAVLNNGLMMRVSSNARANGIVYVSIARSLARRAHIKVGRRASVVIGVGTLSGITNGTVSLHLKLSRSVAAKLRHLSHVTLTVRLALVGVGGTHLAIDAAGRY
jgi:hypothetical protein